MKMLPLLSLVGGLVLAAFAAGCHYPQERDPQEAYDAVPRKEPVSVDHRVEPPDGAELEYLAMSADDKYALCRWTSSRGEAESAGRRFEEKHPGLTWYILWRQKPSW
jgi:hypothetical protein